MNLVPEQPDTPEPTPAEIAEEAIEKRRMGIVERIENSVGALWRMVQVLVILVLAMLVLQGVNWWTARGTSRDVLASQALSNQGRALLCTVAALEVQRTYEIPSYCETPAVIVFVPPEVCAQFDNTSALCGSQYRDK